MFSDFFSIAYNRIEGILKENLVERNCLVPQEWQFTEWNPHKSSNETENLLQSIKASKLLSLCFHTFRSWEGCVYGSLADLWVKTYVTVLYCSLVGCFLGLKGRTMLLLTMCCRAKVWFWWSQEQGKRGVVFHLFLSQWLSKKRNLFFEQRLWVTHLFFCSFNRAYFTPETSRNHSQGWPKLAKCLQKG